MGNLFSSCLGAVDDIPISPVPHLKKKRRRRKRRQECNKDSNMRMPEVTFREETEAPSVVRRRNITEGRPQSFSGETEGPSETGLYRRSDKVDEQSIQSHKSSLNLSNSSINSKQQQREYDGVVLVYKDLQSTGNNSHTFRIYLVSSSKQYIKEVDEECEKEHFSRVVKPPNCTLVERKYYLMSDPKGEIHPEDVLFKLAPSVYKGYFEAYYEQPPPFTFYLKVRGTDVTTWSATIRQDDLMAGFVTWSRDKVHGWMASHCGVACSAGYKTMSEAQDGMSVRSSISLEDETEGWMKEERREEGVCVGPIQAVPDPATMTTQPRPSTHSKVVPATAGPIQAVSDPATVTTKPRQSTHSKVVPAAATAGTKVKENFMKENRTALIERVTDVMGLADDLYDILTSENYDKIKDATPMQEQMRMLLNVICRKGAKAMSAIYDALKKRDPMLVEDLEHPLDPG